MKNRTIYKKKPAQLDFDGYVKKKFLILYLLRVRNYEGEQNYALIHGKMSYTNMSWHHL